MKSRYIAISAAISLVLGIAITNQSIETIPSAPPENLPKGMTPITPEVSKISNPAGPIMIIMSILVLIGTGIYSMIGFLTRSTGQ